MTVPAAQSEPQGTQERKPARRRLWIAIALQLGIPIIYWSTAELYYPVKAMPGRPWIIVLFVVIAILNTIVWAYSISNVWSAFKARMGTISKLSQQKGLVKDLEAALEWLGHVTGRAEILPENKKRAIELVKITVNKVADVYFDPNRGKLDLSGIGDATEIPDPDQTGFLVHYNALNYLATLRPLQRRLTEDNVVGFRDLLRSQFFMFTGALSFFAFFFQGVYCIDHAAFSEPKIAKQFDFYFHSFLTMTLVDIPHWEGTCLRMAVVVMILLGIFFMVGVLGTFLTLVASKLSE